EFATISTSKTLTVFVMEEGSECKTKGEQSNGKQKMV
ncbi:MAG: hypothetical protein XD86_0587, partial [Mesotoga infera]